jgi:hypothetical protein
MDLRRTRRALLAAIAVFLFSGTAWPLELEGIALPDRVRLEPRGAELVLNGAGVRHEAIFKVYVSALYLPARNRDGGAILNKDEPRRLALHFLRDVKAAQFEQATRDALRETLTDEERSPLESRLDRLNEFLATMPDVRQGTEISIDYAPRTGTIIRVNGKEQERIAGADFNRALMRIWLGERPRDPKLKNAMLGAF